MYHELKIFIRKNDPLFPYVDDVSAKSKTSTMPLTPLSVHFFVHSKSRQKSKVLEFIEINQRRITEINH